MVSIIYDYDQIKKFGEMFLQPNESETQLILLFARRKYFPLPKNRIFIRRSLFNGSVNDFLIALKEYETRHLYEREGLVLPNESLVLYFLLNTRNKLDGIMKFRESTDEAIQKCIESKTIFKQGTSLKSCIHKAKSIKKYVELDIDTKDPEKIEKIFKFVYSNVKPVCCIETHGGYHIILTHMTRDIYEFCNQPEFKYDEANINKKLISKKYIDIRRDPQPPIPGTLQGGFQVKFYEGPVGLGGLGA